MTGSRLVKRRLCVFAQQKAQPAGRIRAPNSLANPLINHSKVKIHTESDEIIK